MIYPVSGGRYKVGGGLFGRAFGLSLAEDFTSPNSVDSYNVFTDNEQLKFSGGGAGINPGPTIDGSGSSTQPAGSGTQSDPYQVTTVNELAYMPGDTDGYYELQNDLVFPDPAETGLYGTDGWSPIGGFVGTLDGQGYSMTNFLIDRPNSDNQGLFDFVDTGVVKNFLISGDVTAEYTTGMIAGESSGTVENVSVHGSVSAAGESGGVVGVNDGTISNVYSDADFTLSNNYQGGIVGDNGGGTVENVVYTGSMGSRSRTFQGPIVGDNGGTVTDAYYNSGNVGVSGAGTGLTTSEMQGTAAETNMSLDFTNTWKTISGPVLSEPISVESFTELVQEFYTGTWSFNRWEGATSQLSRVSTTSNGGSAVTGTNMAELEGTSNNPSVTYPISNTTEISGNIRLENAQSGDSDRVSITLNNNSGGQVLNLSIDPRNTNIQVNGQSTGVSVQQDTWFNFEVTGIDYSTDTISSVKIDGTEVLSDASFNNTSQGSSGVLFGCFGTSSGYFGYADNLVFDGEHPPDYPVLNAINDPFIRELSEDGGVWVDSYTVDNDTYEFSPDFTVPPWLDIRVSDQVPDGTETPIDDTPQTVDVTGGEVFVRLDWERYNESEVLDSYSVFAE